MKKILLTGATGFVGRHCRALLAARGYDVHAISRNPPCTSEGSVNWHELDLMDTQESEELFHKLRPSHLLHLAWDVEPDSYWTSTNNVRWVEASLSMLRAFVENGGRRVVVAGTCAEYDWKYGYCSESVTPIVPHSLYGSCKNSLHGVIAAMATQMQQLTYAWGRIFFLYGPHESPSRLVPSTIRSLLRGATANCLHGDQVRDFLHVRDAASALVELAESSVNGAVNIASGTPVMLKDVVQNIAAALDREEQILVDSKKSDEPSVLLADDRRLRDEVGWRPSFDLHTGLDDVIAWWRAQLAAEDKGNL